MTPPASTTRPDRKGYLQPTQLTGYLAGFAGTAALLGAPQAEAAVTAVTFGFGSQFDLSDGTGSYNRWTVGSFGFLKAYATGSSLSLGYHPLSSVGGVVYHDNSVGVSNSGLVRFFANGTAIGGGGNGAKGYAYFQSNNPLLDLTSDQLNKNIGFKTNTNNWGWANVSWNETAKSLTINGAFVESVAGNSITINESLLAPAPEPSRALLALAGLGGMALRRRRKQVA